MGVGSAVIDGLRHFLPDLTDQNLVRLQFTSDESLELPTIWVLAVSWWNIWEARTAGKQPELYKIRADLEAKVSLLRETRHHTNNVVMIEEIISKI